MADTADLSTIYLILLVGAVLLPRRRAALAGAALVAYAIGAGAFAVLPRIDEVGPLVARLRTFGLARSFTSVNIGLMLLAACVVGGAGLAALAERGIARAGAAAALVAAITALYLLAPLLAFAGLGAAAVAAVTAGTVAAVAWIGAALQRAARSRSGEHGAAGGVPARAPADAADAAGAAAGSVHRAAAWTAAGAAVVALAVPHVLAIVAAAFIGGIAAHLALRTAPDPRRRTPQVPVLPLLLLVLVPFGWYTATIAGPVGLSLATLADVPLSEPAQLLLAPLGMGAVWALLGLWPLHRLVPGPMLAPLAGALLVRVLLPAFPAGLAHLQMPVCLLAALGLVHAAAARRPAAGAAALAFAAAVVPSADARASIVALLTVATAAALLERADPRLTIVAWRALALGAGWAGYLALGAGLQAEVVLTLVLAAASAVLVWRLRV